VKHNWEFLAVSEREGRGKLLAHRRNDEIEVLRGLSVLLVLFEHINTLLYWRTYNFEDYVYTYGGVDLFFCISGFVITSAFGRGIAEAVGTGRKYWVTVLAFWARRAYRILPLAWAVVLFNFVLFELAFGGHMLRAFAGDFIAIALDIENFHYASCALIPNPYCGPNGVYWSLSLEEQFYLAFPFLFLLPRKWQVLILVGIVLVFVWLPRTSLVWMIRLDAIALGVLLGFVRTHEFYRVFEPRILRAARLRWPIITILVTALVVVPAGAGLVPFYPTMVSLIALGLVFVASYDNGYLMPAGRARSLMVWVGQRSFAIYLVHNTVFWVVAALCRRSLVNPHGSGIVVLAVAVAAVLIAGVSDLSFRLLETPLRRRGQRIATDMLKNTEESVDDVTPAVAHR
jgi:peptidoglycan/LPS O-acetylase OafA/YrhL